MHPKNKHLPAIIAIFFLGLAAYWPTFFHEYLCDDYNFLTGKYKHLFQNPIDFFFQIGSQHYQPLYFMTNMYLFDHLASHPIVLHAIHLFLFYLCCLSVYFLVYEISAQKALAFLSTTLFCLHPLTANSVYQITHHTIFLFTIFMLGTLYFYLKFLNNRRIGFYWAGLGSFALSLLCVENALFFIFYFFITALIWKKERFKTSVIHFLPFSLISALYVIFWFKFVWPVTALGIKMPSLFVSIKGYLASLSALLIWYMNNLFYPDSVVLSYNIFPIDNAPAIFILFPFAFILLLIYLSRKNTLLLGAIAWFSVGIIPILPAVFTHAYMGYALSPHWMFFPLIGFFISIAWILLALKNRMPPFWGNFLIIIVCFYFFIFTQNYNILYRSEKSFCSYWLSKTPNNPIPLYRLGYRFAQQKNWAKTIEYFQRTLDISNYEREKIYANLAMVYMETNNIPLAKKNVLLSLELNDQNPYIYNILGAIALEEGSRADAEKAYARAIAIDPYYKTSLFNLIDLYILEEKNTQAINLIKKSFKIAEKSEENILSIRLAGLYERTGNLQEGKHLIENLFQQPFPVSQIIGSAKLLQQMRAFHLSAYLLQRGLEQFPDNQQLKTLLLKTSAQ